MGASGGTAHAPWCCHNTHMGMLLLAGSDGAHPARAKACVPWSAGAAPECGGLSAGALSWYHPWWGGPCSAPDVDSAALCLAAACMAGVLGPAVPSHLVWRVPGCVGAPFACEYGKGPCWLKRLSSNRAEHQLGRLCGVVVGRHEGQLAGLPPQCTAVAGQLRV